MNLFKIRCLPLDNGLLTFPLINIQGICMRQVFHPNESDYVYSFATTLFVRHRTTSLPLLADGMATFVRKLEDLTNLNVIFKEAIKRKAKTRSLDQFIASYMVISKKWFIFVSN